MRACVCMYVHVHARVRMRVHVLEFDVGQKCPKRETPNLSPETLNPKP